MHDYWSLSPTHAVAAVIGFTVPPLWYAVRYAVWRIRAAARARRFRRNLDELEDLLDGYRPGDDVSRETCPDRNHESCFGRDGCEYQ